MTVTSNTNETYDSNGESKLLNEVYAKAAHSILENNDMEEGERDTHLRESWFRLFV